MKVMLPPGLPSNILSEASDKSAVVTSSLTSVGTSLGNKGRFFIRVSADY